MTQSKRKPAPAGAQRPQQHTAGHPTAQDTQTIPAPHNRQGTERKKKEKKREAKKNALKQKTKEKQARSKRTNKQGGGRGRQDEVSHGLRHPRLENTEGPRQQGRTK